mmetsp:Transcript_17148/g.30822  ORF Transcript_17148/g.30822 Transcript_17148/m.30822 type:complete len:81 (-) Transcript_17148:3279-3521(-)
MLGSGHITLAIILMMYWRNDLTRLRKAKSWFACILNSISKRRLEPTRALMDLHEFKSREELLDYNPAEKKYKWVLVTKLK